MRHNKGKEVMDMLSEISTFPQQLTAKVPNSALDWDNQIYLYIKGDHEILFDSLDELHTYLSAMRKYKYINKEN